MKLTAAQLRNNLRIAGSFFAFQANLEADEDEAAKLRRMAIATMDLVVWMQHADEDLELPILRDLELPILRD